MYILLFIIKSYIIWNSGFCARIDIIYMLISHYYYSKLYLYTLTVDRNTGCVEQECFLLLFFLVVASLFYSVYNMTSMTSIRVIRQVKRIQSRLHHNDLRIESECMYNVHR